MKSPMYITECFLDSSDYTFDKDYEKLEQCFTKKYSEYQLEEQTFLISVFKKAIANLNNLTWTEKMYKQFL